MIPRELPVVSMQLFSQHGTVSYLPPIERLESFMNVRTVEEGNTCWCLLTVDYHDSWLPGNKQTNVENERTYSILIFKFYVKFTENNSRKRKGNREITSMPRQYQHNACNENVNARFLWRYEVEPLSVNRACYGLRSHSTPVKIPMQALVELAWVFVLRCFKQLDRL